MTASSDSSPKPRSSVRWRRLGALAALAACILLVTTSGHRNLTQAEKIRQRGSLVMLTINGASTWYMGSEGEAGFEYELAREFSRYLGLPLEVVTVPDVSQLIPALEKGQGDFIAANLTRIADRQRKLRFGPVYGEVEPMVVYRRDEPRPESVADLNGGRLALMAGTVYKNLLNRHDRSIDPQLRARASIEDLFEAVSSGEIDYTIIDSNILALNRPYFPAIRPAFALDDPQSLAWATLRSDDDSLTQAMREFFHLVRSSGLLDDLRDRYYSHIESYEPVGTFTFMQRIRDRLPELKPLFEQAASEYGLDWRLLAAIGYQESHWDSRAVSRTGVRGIMMLTQRTARQLGVEDRIDPEQSIMGGARYLKSMLRRIPERIEEPDRLWLALAAYNIGYGHLEDARVLTERRGGDPDRWADVRESLPLLTQEHWYSQTRFGYARGYEPVQYVENIRTFKDILLWMELRNHPLMASLDSDGDAAFSKPVAASR
ncbi:MAG TPA: membrane-bound lytic murein transglycosylase MltF [Wenzhouxiangella sp.]|nr:membrane-bound lytic murein transglycosylase MltF [Wenzhouxiangella sp.]